MLLAMALAAATGQTILDRTSSGVYVSSDGHAFTIISPRTIWSTYGSSFYTAYGFSKVDIGTAQGVFDQSKTMTTGYVQNDQTDTQYKVLSDALASLPANSNKVPELIPCIPTTGDLSKVKHGSLQVALNQLLGSLHFKWTLDDGSNDWSGDALKVGGREKIKIVGIYSDRLGMVTLAEEGSGEARSVIGSAVVGGKKYSLNGLDIWGRGTFQLTNPGSSESVGTGWFAWAPSSDLVSHLKQDKPISTDQIRIHFDAIDQGGIGTRLLTRVVQ